MGLTGSRGKLGLHSIGAHWGWLLPKAGPAGQLVYHSYFSVCASLSQGNIPARLSHVTAPRWDGSCYDQEGPQL